MSTEQSSQAVDRSTIVSRSPGMAYERMRAMRPSHFAQSLTRKLTVQGALLAVLATTLAVGLVLGPDTGTGPTRDLSVLAAGAGSLLAVAVTVHAAVGAYRLRREPITEREALALLVAEDAASYLGIGTGGLLVAAVVAFATVRAATGIPLGSGPTTTSGAVAAGTATAAVLALLAGRFVDGRLPRR